MPQPKSPPYQPLVSLLVVRLGSGADSVRGGQQFGLSRSTPSESHTPPMYPTTVVRQSGCTIVQLGGGVHALVSGPRFVLDAIENTSSSGGKIDKTLLFVVGNTRWLVRCWVQADDQRHSP